MPQCCSEDEEESCWPSEDAFALPPPPPLAVVDIGFARGAEEWLDEEEVDTPTEAVLCGGPPGKEKQKKKHEHGYCERRHMREKTHKIITYCLVPFLPVHNVETAVSQGKYRLLVRQLVFLKKLCHNKANCGTDTEAGMRKLIRSR